jgi:beta-N-acetylhexosaminidase
LEEHELKVFRKFAAPGADSVDSMMIGHIAFAELDPSGLPASLAPAITTRLLREEMGFEGLIMTDDLDMGAILNHYGFDEMIRLGLAAGNDLLMICHRMELAEQAAKILANSPTDQMNRALANIAAFKARMAPPTPFSEEAFQILDQSVWDLRVATLGADGAAARSPEDGKRSPVEVY